MGAEVAAEQDVPLVAVLPYRSRLGLAGREPGASR